MSQKELWRIRKRVQRMFPVDGQECECCESTSKLQRHHRDGDITNNPKDGSNISYLCVECHQELHSNTSYHYRSYLAMATA